MCFLALYIPVLVCLLLLWQNHDQKQLVEDRVPFLLYQIVHLEGKVSSRTQGNNWCRSIKEHCLKAGSPWLVESAFLDIPWPPTYSGQQPSQRTGTSHIHCWPRKMSYRLAYKLIWWKYFHKWSSHFPNGFWFLSSLKTNKQKEKENPLKSQPNNTTKKQSKKKMKKVTNTLVTITTINFTKPVMDH